MDDTKHIGDLQAASYNPRKMSEHDVKALRRSIDELGDLGGIIKNIQTGNLVGGHQRIEVMKQVGNAEIVYTWHTSETPGPSGTTALGYILHPTTGERFSYREVSWPLEREKVANIAANRISGDWDLEALAQVNYDLSQLPNADDLLATTGQSQREIEKLLASVGVEPNGEEQPDELGADPKDEDGRRISATNEQWEMIDEAVEYIKARVPIPSEDNGSKYGSALYYMSRVFLEGVHQQAEQKANETETPTGDSTLLTP
jgi:hypothetical protein